MELLCFKTFQWLPNAMTFKILTFPIRPYLQLHILTLSHSQCTPATLTAPQYVLYYVPQDLRWVFCFPFLPAISVQSASIQLSQEGVTSPACNTALFSSTTLLFGPSSLTPRRQGPCWSSCLLTVYLVPSTMLKNNRWPRLNDWMHDQLVVYTFSPTHSGIYIKLVSISSCPPYHPLPLIKQ